MSVVTNSSNMLIKVRKLIDHANSTNVEAERMSFLAKAQEMMQKFAISEAQLEATKQTTERKPIDIVVQMPKIVGKNAIVSLSCNIANINRGFVSRSYGNSIRFSGMPEDVSFMELLFTSLILFAEQEYERIKGNRPTWTHQRTYKANFYEGFCGRIRDRLKSESHKVTTETNGTDLVLLKGVQDRVLEDVRIRLGIKAKYFTRRVDTSYCESGRNAGYKAGSKADLTGGSRRGVNGSRGLLNV